MGIGKLLTLLILAGLGYMLYKRIKAIPRKTRPDNPQVDKVVRCAYCDLHVPQQEAIELNNRYYCSEEHRRLDQQSKE